MNVLSLFAGIGGLELGLERAGMSIVGQVELDPFCRSILAHHWPEVPKHDDVRTAPGWWASAVRPAVDLVTGGFPCQPFSTAGRRRGIADERWGWPWMAAVVRVVRPRYVLVENVAALLDDGDAFGWVLRDLAALGFDAQWSVLPACAVGAPHTRERLFLVAHSHRVDGPPRVGLGNGRPLPRRRRGPHPWPDPINGLLATPPDTSGMAHGIPPQLDGPRVRALGNAVVPHVAEHIGHMIRAHDHATRHAHREAA